MRKIQLIIGLLVGIMLIVLLTHNLLKKDPQPQVEEATEESVALPESVNPSPEARKGIEVVAARLAPVERVIGGTGSLRADPDRKSLVTAPVTGVVVRYTARLGQWVLQGEPIVELDSADVAKARGDYALALRELEAAQTNLKRERALAELGSLSRDPVESARRDLSEANAAQKTALSEVEVARSQVSRVEELAREEIISQRDLELARAELSRAQARLEAARQILQTRKTQYAREQKTYQSSYLAARVLEPLESEVAQKSRAVETASRTLDAMKAGPGEGGFVSVSAPIEGFLVARSATLGESVQSTAHLAEIQDNRLLWAVVDFYEKDLDQLKDDVAADVQPATGGAPVRGRLEFIQPRVETPARTVEGWVRLTHPPRSFREGMFVKVDVHVPLGRQGVMVPSDAVQELEGQKVVFVESASGEYQRRAVKVGVQNSAKIELLDGLKAGEKVVTEGAFRVKSEFLRGTIGDED